MMFEGSGGVSSGQQVTRCSTRLWAFMRTVQGLIVGFHAALQEQRISSLWCLN